MLAPRTLITLLLALLCASSLAACSDDDGNGASTQSPTRTAAATRSPARTATPSDQKTPPPSETPFATPGPEPTGTPPPTAAEGIPAIAPADQAGFVAQFQGRNVVEELCGYSPVTRLATCGDTRYAVNPPLSGQDIACFRLIVDGQREAIRCTSQEPLATLYYDIQ